MSVPSPPSPQRPAGAAPTACPTRRGRCGTGDRQTPSPHVHRRRMPGGQPCRLRPHPVESSNPCLLHTGSSSATWQTAPARSPHAPDIRYPGSDPARAVRSPGSQQGALPRRGIPMSPPSTGKESPTSAPVGISGGTRTPTPISMNVESPSGAEKRRRAGFGIRHWTLDALAQHSPNASVTPPATPCVRTRYARLR